MGGRLPPRQLVHLGLHSSTVSFLAKPISRLFESDMGFIRIEYFDSITAALGQNERNYRIADWAEYWTSQQLLATEIMASPMRR
jgi:hypothetical protein